MDIRGHAAIVTGGASGLGAATARMLAQAGAKVAIFDVNAKGAAEVAIDVNGVAVACDVTDSAATEKAVASAAADHGIARIVVSCAGVGPAKRIVGLVLPAAREFAQFGIRVTAVAPGIFSTPMLHALPEAAQQSLAASVPFPKLLGQPPQYAALVRHMIENRYLNGEVVRLDGALRMAPR